MTFERAAFERACTTIALLACVICISIHALPAAGASSPAIRSSVESHDFWVEEIADGLKFPSTIVWLPNGDALVTEREGGLRLLRSDKLDPRPIPGVPASFQNNLNGLRDLALDPDFQSNRLLYLLISEGDARLHHASVYRARYEYSGLKAVERIFRSKDSTSGWGEIANRMIFLPDKTMLVAVAEDNFHKMMAQRLDSHIGKILRIARDGSPPHDNPLLGKAGALPEIWSYGHRGPTGLYRDPNDRIIWEVEPGPDGGDEINILKAGANYGWAEWTWGFEYGGGLAGPRQRGVEIESPVHVWMGIPHAKTPSGITRYHGDRYPWFKGDFFVGHLSGRSLQRLRIENGAVVFEEKLLADLQERIREAKEGPDQYLYILTDNPNGRLLRLQPGTPAGSQLSRVATKAEQPVAGSAVQDYINFKLGDAEKGKQGFLERCSGCHGVGTVVEGGCLGPDLKGVVGRFAGSGEFDYSKALASLPQRWTIYSLDLFLRDPRGYLPGTSMAAPPLADEELRRHILAFLVQQTDP